MNGFSDVVGRSRAWLARVFISRPFSRVLAGQVVSVTGSNATAVVVPLIAVITLNASSFEVGVLNAAESLAAAVLGIHIGRWCDRIGPDRVEQPPADARPDAFADRVGALDQRVGVRQTVPGHKRYRIAGAGDVESQLGNHAQPAARHAMPRRLIMVEN